MQNCAFPNCPRATPNKSRPSRQNLHFFSFGIKYWMQLQRAAFVLILPAENIIHLSSLYDLFFQFSLLHLKTRSCWNRRQSAAQRTAKLLVINRYCSGIYFVSNLSYCTSFKLFRWRRAHPEIGLGLSNTLELCSATLTAVKPSLSGIL